jgi:hypothetical protein
MDFCGQCQRRVHNLDLMSMSERDSFFKGCSGEVCVSYTINRRPLPIAVGLGLAALAAGPITNADDTLASPTGIYCEGDWVEVIVGGTEAGEKLQWVDESELQRPDKADLPDISASSWLPAPKS